jgi:hypothetical protein
MMISQRAKAVGLIALLSAAVVCAEQVWKNRPPDKWSEKDAKKILKDSPWAKPAMMPYHPLTELGNRGPVAADPQVRVGRVPLDPDDDPINVDARPSWTVTVIWSSSRTVRRAVARDGSKAYRPEPQHSEPRQRYEITVLTQTSTWPLPDWRESELRESTHLKFGKNGQEVRPDRVTIAYFPGTHRVESYWFAFAREDVEGVPYLRKGVREVQFYSQLGPVAIRAKFEPAKMVAHDGPDL